MSLPKWSRTRVTMRRFGIGWLFSAALIPGILAGALLLHKVYQNERDDLEQAAQQTARALAQLVERDIAGIQGKLQILAMSPYLTRENLATLYRQAQDVLATETVAEAIVVIDSTGQQVLNTARPFGAELKKTGHPDTIRRTFETGQSTVSNLFIGSITERPFVSVEVPVRREGKVAYALIMAISSERLNQILVAQNLPKDWLAALLDRNGVVVARSQNAARFVGQKGGADLIEQMGKVNEGSFASHTLEGEPSFVAFSHPALTGWTVAVGMSRDVLYRNLYASMALTIVTMVAFIAVGGILALLFSWHMRASLRGLEAATAAAEAGDLTAVAPLAGPLEVERLAAQFNRMQEARRKVEAQLRVAASVVSETAEGIMITDQNARIIEVNPAFTELTGYTRREVIGRNPHILDSGVHDATFFTTMWRSLNESGRWQGQIWDRRKDGKLFAARMTLGAVKDVDGHIHRYIGLFSDVTEQTRLQEEIGRMAYHDPLTQLPNRRMLFDRLHQALANADRQGTLIAVCSLDVDNFKPINDGYGHEAGDRVLVEFARRLLGAVRPHDTVARTGGDEFVLLLTNVNSQNEIDAVLERVVHDLGVPMVLDNGQIAVISVSIGVTIYPLTTADVDKLLRNSDLAMYRAKQDGRDQVQFF